jgi:hypothetical protein
VTRVRLRPTYTPEQLAALYAAPHDHTRWEDHRIRVAITIEACRWFVRRGDVHTVADLSCGDAAIARALDVGTVVLGDFAPGYDHTGPLETTIEQIPPVDLFICSETIEHLDEPETALKQIRAKTRHLVLSTPVDAGQDANPEHYWSWDRPDVEAMLTAAGFTVEAYTAVDLRPAGFYYQFGIWACR